MHKIGTTTYSVEIIEENFKKLSESHIDAVEVAIPFEKLEYLDYKKAYELSKKYNVELWSCHLPFHTTEVLDIASLSEDIRKKSVELVREHVKRATDIGIKNLVIHPSSEPVSVDEEKRRNQLENSMKSLDELAETAGEGGGVIAVENLPRTCLGRDSSEILKILSANHKLRVCFDTNHLLYQDAVSFIEEVGSKIVTLHVSDYDFADERHWLPGDGGVDWSKIVSALTKVGYNGVWMYEVALKSAGNTKRTTDIAFEELYDNAKKILPL